MKLIQGLLYQILDNPNASNKYTKSYLNLKNVFKLETENKFKFNDEIKKEFEEITKKYNSFMNKIPLKVVETYFRQNVERLDSYVFIDYNGNEITDCKYMDIYVELELFFEDIFALACQIANLYNLEVKLKNSTKDSKIEMI